MNISDITSKLGITLNEMQIESADKILHNSDNVVILSPTGTGKTLAYMLPLVQMIDSSNVNLQAIVIVPGRELAQQSEEVLKSLKTSIKSYACYGGRPTMDEHRDIRRINPQIIFSTPGRFNDHLDKGNISTEYVRFVVIDEFDKCLEMGFRNEMTLLLSRVSGHARRIFLSATDFEENIEGFIRLDFRAIHSDEAGDRVNVYTVFSPEKDKLQTLSKLLRSFGQESTIVFLNYRKSVMRTSDFLQSEGFYVSAYHGGLEQKDREQAIYKFANGSVNILVCTDLGSRGLDMPIVKNIVHYHIPETEDAYIHRVGRSTRWNNVGRTFFILNNSETLPEYVVNGEVKEYVLPETFAEPSKPQMATLYIGKGKKNKISKGDIVGFLCKKGGLKSSDIGRIDVFEYYALAAISFEKFNETLRKVKGEKIKGQKTIIEEHN